MGVLQLHEERGTGRSLLKFHSAVGILTLSPAGSPPPAVDPHPIKDMGASFFSKVMCDLPPVNHDGASLSSADQVTRGSSYSLSTRAG